MVQTPMHNISSEFMHNARIPSPVEEVDHPLLSQYGVSLFIKRDDLIHEQVSGNKYRKLKYNLLDAQVRRVERLVTFGGAFSNHLYAFAAACRLAGIPCTGFVRGEIDPFNPTMQFCREQGMDLISVTREDYRQKENSPFVREYLRHLQNAQVIPEGGSNALALKGVTEIMEEIQVQLQDLPDVMIVSAGTGGTAAGLLTRLPHPMKLLVFSALKSNHLYREILDLAGHPENADSLTVADSYHFGGYGKTQIQLTGFMDAFEESTGIPLDPVYTGKAMFGFFEELKNGRFPRGSRILFLHTGGLQGRNGMEYRRNEKMVF